MNTIIWIINNQCECNSCCCLGIAIVLCTLIVCLTILLYRILLIIRDALEDTCVHLTEPEKSRKWFACTVRVLICLVLILLVATLLPIICFVLKYSSL